ncbi:hypothetical protein ACFO0N_11290 [Halobium salinum]|uniref:Uncharacterized protein n=1 Tax=Halobium salinum TaxID=1364940 RepID=A0ABD5PCB0_9EURY|nr:hypothetical protein [Halobium salinum]
MPPLSSTAFRERLAALSLPDRAAFVAAVWRARGRSASVDGTRVRIAEKSSADGVESRSWVVDVDFERREADDVDSDDRRYDGEALLDPADLRRLLLYALPAETGDRLVRAHLGVALRSTQYPRATPPDAGDSTDDAELAGDLGGAVEAEGPDEGGGPDDAEAADDVEAASRGSFRGTSDSLGPWVPTSRRRQAVVVLVGVAVVAAVLGGGGLGLPSLGSPDGALSTADEGTTTTESAETAASDAQSAVDGTGAGSASATDPARTASGAEESPDDADSPPDDAAPFTGGDSDASLPPGVTPNAVDARALAAAHGRVLGNTSYTLVLTHREFRDGRPTAVRREVARVEGSERYVSSVTGAGEPTATVQVVADEEVFANGSVRVERGVDGEPRDARSGQSDFAEPDDPFRSRAENYVDWFTSVREAGVVETVERDGRTLYWLSLADDPWLGVENSTGSALVDERGLVHSLRRSYDVPGRPGVSVTVTVEVVNVGETTAPAPAWYRSGAAATDPDDGTPGAPETEETGSDTPNVSAASAEVEAGGEGGTAAGGEVESGSETTVSSAR